MSVKWAVWAMAALGIAGCKAPEEPRPQNGAESEAAIPGIGRTEKEKPGDSTYRMRRDVQSRLESAYDSLEARMDSLWGDSLNIHASMRNQYRRILNDARTVKDNTKVHLEELRVSSEGVTPEIWEEIRARAQLSLDSLRRLFISADSTRKLNRAEIVPEKSP